MVHIKKHLSKKKKENDYKFLTYQISLDQGSANFQAQLDVCFLFFGATSHSLWDLSSLTRDWTQALGRESVES